MDYAGYLQKQFGANLYRLKEKLPNFLEREMGLSAKKHFRCLNPAHEDRHPSMSYYPAGQCVKCFSCGFTGDLLTVAGLYWGISDEKEIIPRLLQYYPDCRCSTSNKAEISSYLLQRGLSEDIIRWSGAVEVSDVLFGRAVRLPYHQGDYAAYRSVSEKRFRKPAGIPEPVCFPEFLQESGPIFLVEAYICALSVYQCGGKAIPCNGVGYRQILEALGNRRPRFLVAFDRDARGMQAAEQFVRDYAAMGGAAEIVDLSGPYKDPNERLMKDPAGLQAAVDRACAAPDIVCGFPQIQDYLDTQFFEELSGRAASGGCLTGFSGIDRQLGGLTPGLYILGGIPSVGKTTFLGQLAVNFAQQGQSVLFLSYEQSPFEFLCKTLARMSYLTQPQAFSSAELMHGLCDDRVREMAEVYRQQVVDLCVLKVRDTAEQLSERMRRFADGRTHPVILVDYLQFIPGPGSDPRWNNDCALQMLAQMAAELEAVLIVVSSFNRSSYLMPVAFESFKESGNVEYYADGLWGLSYAVLSSPLFQRDGQMAEKQLTLARAREQRIRKLEFRCVKARHGSLFSVGLDYDPAHDYFCDAPQVSHKRL